MAGEQTIHDAPKVRRYLLERRHQDPLPTFGDVANVCGWAPNGLGPLLDYIRDDCQNHAEPDLTVLVVNSETGLPTKFEGRTTDLDLGRWRLAVKKVREAEWPRDELA